MSDTTNIVISSPISSGGSGTLFEQHVGAFFLSLLLVKGFPPVFKDCFVSKVSFQTKIIGWKTDDILVEARRGDGTSRKLAVQVKRSFTVSESNKDCVETFERFWADFNNNEIFNKAVDQLLLITLQGTNVLYRGLCGLLVCARSSSCAVDFNNRLSTPRFVDQKASNYCKVIRKIVSKNEEVSDESFWRFLQTIHFLSLDLNTSTCQTESLVKGLLAQSVSGNDRVGTATAIWNELVVLASSFIPDAKSIDNQELLAALTTKYTAIDLDFGPVLQRIAAHSEFVLADIKTEIKSYSVPRFSLQTELLDKILNSQIVLISGREGSGKSSLVKSSLEAIATENIVGAFRAEEFQESHIDKVFQANFRISGSEFSNLFISHPRKVFLVDSVERLLENENRKAFIDFLNLLKRDTSLKLVLTCRSYSVELIKSNFFEDRELSEIVVPIFETEEFDSIVSKLPNLSPVLNNTRLMTLLRIPYLLNMASKMNWSEEDNAIGHEETFRRKLWADVVRKNTIQADSMPLRRQEAFIRLAHSRATDMKTFVSLEGFDLNALTALHNDGLVAFSNGNQNRAAPSHDVLEDWAVITWIEGEFEKCSSDFSKLPEILGTAPAIRRSYRYWLRSKVELEGDSIKQYLREIVGSENTLDFFRDDTLLSIVTCSSEPSLLSLQELLNNEDGSTLRRVIHLVRVACKSSPVWVPPDQRPLFLVASGGAWSSVALAIHKNFHLLSKDTNLLIAFIYDFTSLISITNPKPQGWKEVVEIAFALLEKIDHFAQEENIKKLVSVILKFPTANQPAFEALAKKSFEIDERDSGAEIFADVLTSGLNGATACAEMTNFMIEFSMTKFFQVEEVDDDDRFRLVENLFGLKNDLNQKFSPPSAIRGPFLYLLYANPEKGLDFVIRFFNQACEIYSKTKSAFSPPEKKILTLPSGIEKEVWFDDRLWGAYRGLGHVPTLFESGLRALEKWFLDLASKDSDSCHRWMQKVLAESNNASLIAVLSSVVMAHRDLFSKIGLSILSCPAFIEVDQERASSDGPLSKPLRFRPYIKNTEIELFVSETQASDSLPHRGKSLEILCLELQFTGVKDAVLQLLDKYRSELPPAEKQKQRDKLWRMSLHRMDSRKQFSEEIRALPSNGEIGSSESHIVVSIAPIDEDLRLLSEKVIASSTELGELLSIQIWATKRYDGELIDPTWGEKYQATVDKFESGALDPKNASIAKSTPLLVALVGVRDHWDEITAEAKNWCLAQITKLVNPQELKEDRHLYDYRHTIDLQKVGPVLSSLLARSLDAKAEKEVRLLLARCLLSDNRKVSVPTSQALNYHLKEKKPQLLGTMVNVVVAETLDIQKQRNDFQLNRDAGQPSEEISLDEIRANSIRRALLNTICLASDLADIAPDNPFGANAIMLTQLLLSGISSDPLLAQASKKFVEHFCNQSERRANENSAESWFHGLDEISKIILTADEGEWIKPCANFLTTLKKAPSKLADLIDHLLVSAETLGRYDRFWDIWNYFATELVTLCSAKAPIYDLRWYGDIFRSMFFDMSWNKKEHAEGFKEKAGRVDAFFSKLPITKETVSGYLSFLLGIGANSLPAAFIILKDHLCSDAGRKLLTDPSIQYALEILLRRHLFNDSTALKINTNTKDAVCALLDEMIDAGSSVCYQMREDFLLPLKT